MRKKELWLGGLFTLAGVFGSCTNEMEYESQNNKYPMELTAEKATMSFTRTVTEKTEWNGGEEVSLYDGFSQKVYQISADGGMTAKDNDPLYWYTTTEEETLFAWYPATGTLLTEWSVAADQTSEEAYKNSDFLYAYEKMKFRSERRLQFRHGVVKLIINVKGDGDTVKEEDLEGAVFTIESTAIQGSISEGKLQPKEGVVATSMKPYQLETTKEGYVASFQLLLIPQDMSGKQFFKLVLKDGRKFSHTPGNGEGILESGHQYTYNVGVGKPGLKVEIEKDSVSWEGDDEEVEGTDI
ncbi:fimbrillin family protein [Bacteroides sp. GM023]|uniref:fimbrillin family protein n=1 Tax=Bacteroides sp. GM023 TaxID=2723058 RepID=UPI00168B0105|nr:fimbrillin family protein [Bacteroides sp. GM023]MBD3591326.1 fimbrillin family protein [Bacteroides sp. GM023]